MTNLNSSHSFPISQKSFNHSLLDYLQQSPTPFHATAQTAEALLQAGYQELSEKSIWQLAENNGYFIRRNESSIIAFWLHSFDQGFRMVGAHTDSPCLKVKPNADLNRQGYWQLGVEVYGGALLAPWFDRDLSIAGRVHAKVDGVLQSILVNFEQPIATIPSLAIHLDREANKGRTINPQTQLPPVLALSDQELDLQTLLLNQVQKQVPDAEAVVDYELFFYDTQAPDLIGLNQEFIASARLDNLLSCYVGLQGLLAQSPSENAMVVFTDHEEVGSASACGAQGPFLQHTLERIWPEPELRNRMIADSFMISADNAHGIHPNFAEKHDQNHGPKLNKGPVIKVNANQRYATNSRSAAIFKQLCEETSVSVQTFVTRTDMGCGSTIGPITASEVGVETLDVGLPSFGMHSIRELAGSEDAFELAKVLAHYFRKADLDSSSSI